MNDRVELRQALLEHYDRAGRELPWRGESDPYRILVSEVMLQQTRVETVQKFYGPWLERFPDWKTLAAAADDEVLKAWEGLGYYRRAHNLRRTALIVREAQGERLPSNYDALRALPGVGEYTAGAVASIAFGQVAPAVDGNVRRVLARLFDVPDPDAAWLRVTARELVDRERPGDWNQALMELGATLCTPRAPACEECPLDRWCAAKAAGTQAARPTPKRRRRVPTGYFVLGVFHASGRVLLVKRPPRGLLAGMWAFPESQSMDAPPGETRVGSEVASLVTEMGLAPVGDQEPLPRCEHRFTHLHAVYLPTAVEVLARRSVGGRAWIDPLVGDDLALPVAQRKVLDAWKELMTTGCAGR